MTPQELKASILQLAIQGKLVEQRPEEGTGAELLEKILAASASAKASADKKNTKGTKKNSHAESRSRGVPSSHVSHLESSHAVEKISAHATLPSKNISANSASPREEIPDSEKPFDIPESWVWVKLGEVADVQLGKMLDKGKNKGTPYPYLANLSVRWGSFDLSSLKMMPFTEDECKKFALLPGDVLMCEGGVPGRCAVWRLKNSQIKYQKAVHRIRSRALLADFIQRFFEAICDSSRFASQFTGTTIKHLPRETLVQTLIPLPPLAEQKRIVAKIEELLPYIDRYEKAWSKLEEFNKRFPGDMQKSLLQMAIQGKLVEQRPDEGTGEELYRQIQSEKQRLIKSGKIKKEKPLPEITPDEIPFDIPESWKWVRLGEICKSIADGDHQPPPQVPSGIPFLVISNVSKGTLDFSNTRFVPMAYFNSLSGERIPGRGDILFTVTGSYGIPLKIDINRSFCFQRHMALLKLLTNREYLFYALMSPVVQKQCDNAATGTAQKTVGLNALRNLLIPLPPLAEQKRIVAKLEELLPLCERLK